MRLVQQDAVQSQWGGDARLLQQTFRSDVFLRSGQLLLFAVQFVSGIVALVAYKRLFGTFQQQAVEYRFPNRFVLGCPSAGCGAVHQPMPATLCIYFQVQGNIFRVDSPL